MITKDTLKQYIATNSKNVRVRQSTEYPSLSVLKYDKKVFYNNLWDKELMQLRGTVVDTDFNLKVLPFAKTFNRLELHDFEFERNEMVVAVRKINGFMCSVTFCPELGHPIICTTGSLDSAFCDYARHVIPETAMFWITKNSFGKEVMDTYMFEIVHPEDPHIVPEEIGAYFLGIRPCTYDELNHQVNYQDVAFQEMYDYDAKQMGVLRPEWKEARWSDIVEEVKTVKHEGFMCWGSGLVAKSVKLKSPYYSITKFLGRRTPENWLKQPNSVPSPLKDYENIVLDIKHQIDTKFLNFFALEDPQDKIKIVRGLLDEQEIYNK